MNFSIQRQALRARAGARDARDLKEAKRYLGTLGANGGTEMLSGIRAALGFARDPQRARFVTFLTDGYIGNEAEILREVHQSIGDARIFSFGVGDSVNRYLLDGLAMEGRGAAAYLGLAESADEVMGFYFDRISRPALTDVAIDWRGLAVRDVYPARLPDLFVGPPDRRDGQVQRERQPALPCAAGPRARTWSCASKRPSSNARSPRCAAFGRGCGSRISRAEQTWGGDPAGELSGAIRTTALEYGLMSAYTSFVAVDASERTAGDRGTTVNQSVPVPNGVRYDTSVAER